MSDTTAEPARKRVRRAMDEGPEIASVPVLVIVGQRKEKFYIHEALLRLNSRFFNTAMKKEWKEVQDRHIEIPAIEVDIFKIWVKWLYTGRIFLTKDDDHSDVTSKEWPRWSKCYALGDFLEDSDFKDACIDCSIEIMCTTGRIPVNMPAWIYNNSTPTSAHRQAVIDTFVNCCRRTSWLAGMTPPSGFLVDILECIGPKLSSGIKLIKSVEYFNLNDTCKYHDHGSEKTCYKMKPSFCF